MPNTPLKQILLVDDDENLVDALAEFLELAAAVKCYRLRSLSEVKGIWPKISESKPILAILDINLGAGEPSGVEVYHWLNGQGFRGQSFFLTGHAKDHPLVQQAIQIEGIKVFEKPMEIDRIIALVEEAAR